MKIEAKHKKIAAENTLTQQQKPVKSQCFKKCVKRSQQIRYALQFRYYKYSLHNKAKRSQVTCCKKYVT